MANQKHLTLLKQGIAIWNQWRQEHSEIRPDLSRADLSHANLYVADFLQATLYGANFRGAVRREVAFIIVPLAARPERNLLFHQQYP